MRPRKRILLIDQDDDRRGEFGFLLRVKGYATLEIADQAIELIVAHWPIDMTAAIHLKVFCDCPLLIIAPKKAEVIGADMTLRVPIPHEELLTRIRILSERKRGPKKGIARKPPETSTSEPAATAASA